MSEDTPGVRVATWPPRSPIPMELVAAFPVDVVVREKWEKARRDKKSGAWVRTCKVQEESQWVCHILDVTKGGDVYGFQHHVAWNFPAERGWRRMGVELEESWQRGGRPPEIVDRDIVWEGGHADDQGK